MKHCITFTNINCLGFLSHFKQQTGLLLVLSVLLFSAGCQTTKYLAEDETLYDKAVVDVETEDIPERFVEPLEEHLEELILPKPNAKLLGWRYKLGFWNMAGGDRDSSNNFFTRWLRKQGEKPVLMKDANREYNENLLRNRLENMGFFLAEVSSDTLTKGKLGEVHYAAVTGPIYRINSINYEIDSTSNIGKAIKETEAENVLRPKRNYSLDNIIQERERIDDKLKNNGYYYFNPNYLLVEVDSTIGDHKVDLYLTLKPETPKRAKEPQKIGNIIVYPNYTVTDAGYRKVNVNRLEPFNDQGFYFIDPENTYREKVLANHIFFYKDGIYNRAAHNRSINHLVNLNTFKFVKNEFVPSQTDSNTLDVYYYLTPMNRRSLRFEILGKTASVYNGSEVNLNWQIRNAFKGAETLSINVFGGYETQTGGSVSLNSNYYRYGADATITWPRLLSPFKWSSSRWYMPKTYLKAGYEFLDRRTAYRLSSLSMNFGYVWKEDIYKEHDLALAEIVYVQPQNITEAYKQQMDTVPMLKHMIEPQFSFGPNYNFTFTNTVDENLTHSFYFKGGLNLSGNVLGLIQGASQDNQKELFNTPYAQFIKLEADFRHYYKLGRNQEIASRLVLGTSYSYGNSRSLPYLKQYFAGGPNSLRAFRARSVGPGTMMPQYLDKDYFFSDQTGDFKLELNTEYRAKIASILDWAAFIDAGNIWLQREDPDRPGAALTKDFLSELAVGGGLGLRFDFTFLILRTDFAIPFRQPYLPKGERWVFNKIDFKDKQWRKNNLIFNLAIGYPF